MILQTLTNTQNLTLNLVLELTDNGQVLASVLELPNCHVEAATEEQAIAQLRQLIGDRLSKAKILPIEIPLTHSVQAENPWMEFAGIFEGDEEFAELADELRRERKLDVDDTP